MNKATRDQHAVNPSLDWSLQKIRREIPILERTVDGRPICYLDNAASFPKLQTVLEAVKSFSSTSYSNVRRSVHRLSQEATEAFEGVRDLIAKDLGAASSKEIIFTRGTTSALNLLAHGLCSRLQPGDEIVVSRLEHHANFVPWQQYAKRFGLQFKICELRNGLLAPESLKAMITSRTRVISVSAMSNVLGSIQPIGEISELAKRAGAILILDAAQVVAHGPLRLSEWGNPDFLAFSGHKMASPNGVGVLYGREDLLETLEPLEFGGDMISEVRDEDSKWNDLPWKFEAGTPAIDAVIGLGAAWKFFKEQDWKLLSTHEDKISGRVLEGLQNIPGLRIFGPASTENRVPIFSFELSGIHAHDLGSFLDAQGICVRAGHHCAQPLHKSFGIPSTTRASFAFWNTMDEVEVFLLGLQEAREYFVRRGLCKP